MSQQEEYNIRSFRKGDEADLQEYANNPAISGNLRDSFPHPFTVMHAFKWVEINIDTYKRPTNLAITMNDRVIGGIGITLQTDIYQFSAELGYWLGEPFWNKGIMTKAVKAMVQYSFQNFDILRIYAGVFETNIASMKVLEKAGFHLEAIHQKAMSKNGKVFDEHLFVTFKPDVAR